MKKRESVAVRVIGLLFVGMIIYSLVLFSVINRQLITGFQDYMENTLVKQSQGVQNYIDEISAELQRSTKSLTDYFYEEYDGKSDRDSNIGGTATLTAGSIKGNAEVTGTKGGTAILTVGSVNGNASVNAKSQGTATLLVKDSDITGETNITADTGNASFTRSSRQHVPFLGSFV